MYHFHIPDEEGEETLTIESLVYAVVGHLQNPPLVCKNRKSVRERLLVFTHSALWC